MPTPPAENLLTHWLFEASWLPGGLLFFAGLLFVIWILKEGRTNGVRLAFGAMLLGAGIVAAGRLVKTPGEQAEAAVLEFVKAVAERDLVGAQALLAENAHIHITSTATAARDRAALERGLDATARFTIESYAVTGLRGYTVDADRGTVHLGVRVDTDLAPAISSWVIDAVDEGGSWRLERFIWVNLNTQAPPSSW